MLMRFLLGLLRPFFRKVRRAFFNGVRFVHVFCSSEVGTELVIDPFD